MVYYSPLFVGPMGFGAFWNVIANSQVTMGFEKKSRSNDLVFGVPLHSSPSESVHGAIRKCSEGTSMNHHFVQTATQTVFKNPYHGIIHLLSCSSDFPPIIMCSHFFVPSVPWDLDILSGWWYTYPAEKYDEFVSDDEIPNWMESHNPFRFLKPPSSDSKLGCQWTHQFWSVKGS
jgi:hypothetical protein